MVKSKFQPLLASGYILTERKSNWLENKSQYFQTLSLYQHQSANWNLICEVLPALDIKTQNMHNKRDLLILDHNMSRLAELRLEYNLIHLLNQYEQPKTELK